MSRAARPLVSSRIRLCTVTTTGGRGRRTRPLTTASQPALRPWACTTSAPAWPRRSRRERRGQPASAGGWTGSGTTTSTGRMPSSTPAGPGHDHPPAPGLERGGQCARRGGGSRRSKGRAPAGRCAGAAVPPRPQPSRSPEQDPPGSAAGRRQGQGEDGRTRQAADDQRGERIPPGRPASSSVGDTAIMASAGHRRRAPSAGHDPPTDAGPPQLGQRALGDRRPGRRRRRGGRRRRPRPAPPPARSSTVRPSHAPWPPARTRRPARWPASGCGRRPARNAPGSAGRTGRTRRAPARRRRRRGPAAPMAPSAASPNAVSRTSGQASASRAALASAQPATVVTTAVAHQRGPGGRRPEPARRWPWPGSAPWPPARR